MTKQITIPLATLEQIVEVLEVAFQAEGDTFGMMHNDAVDALTAARAAISGVEHKPKMLSDILKDTL